MLPQELRQKAVKKRKIEWQGEKGWFYLFDHIASIATLWANIPKQRIYLQVPYLKVMEKAGLQGTKPYYGIWTNEKGELCAVIYCQVKDFKADESINWADEQNQGQLKNLRSQLKKKLARQLRFTTLVIGNLSMTGPFGQWIETGRSDQRADIIMQMATWAYELLVPDYEGLKAILLKDYFQPLHTERNIDFVQFNIQPAMELGIRKKWRNFSDYLDDLRSKYRVRYRKALKRLEGIRKEQKTGGEIDHTLLKAAYDLYLYRSTNSDFNIATLEPDYFLQLCRELEDKIIFQLYYEKEDLVAFMCMVHDETTLDAQFTGYENKLNVQHDIYLNLLYDVISTAIDLNTERVCFARTAMEIKSSVGAKPRDLYCYLYYNSAIVNLFVPSIIKYMEPRTNWNQRHPFKDEPPS